MRWALVLLALLPCTWCASAGLTTQELLIGLPDCARTCLNESITASSCDANDATCLCAPGSHALNDGQFCATNNCTIKEALTTHNTTNTICGITVRDESHLFVHITIAFGVVSGVFILLRLGSRWWISHAKFGLDDLFIVLTFVVGIPSSVMNVHGTAAHGEGKDLWTIPFDSVSSFFFYFWLLEILYFLQVALLKMSLLFFYLRIFAGPAQTLLWGTIIFNAAFGITFVILAALQCTPASYFWHNWDGEHQGTCLNSNAIGWANAAISIALDLWMLAIPMWQIRNLRLHWKKKIGVAGMFLVGTFVTVVSMVRLKYLVFLGKSHNPTFDETNVSIWSTIEINVGIICASMPSLRILLVRLFPVLGGSSYDASNYQTYGDNQSRRSRIPANRSHAVVELPSRGVSPTRPSHGGIEMKRTYHVQYSDGDELSLVGQEATQGRHGRSVGTSGASTSDLSL